MAQPSATLTANVLDVRRLTTYFYLDEGVLKAVDDVSFGIGPRRTLGLIGESGCGKSVTAQSVLRIVPKPGRIVSGEILLDQGDGRSVDLASLDERGAEVRAVRGKDISMVFQEPMTSLSPVHTIGQQIEEAILLHETSDRKSAHEIALAMLGKVGIPNPAQRIDAYPHQLSGGLRQRAMIAMALSCRPKLLIADEPTTALDVTVQAQILDLMEGLQEQFGMSMLYITHDLGVIAEISEEVAVMYLGKVVEHAPVREIFKHALHPYTAMLLKSIPKVGKKARVRLDAIKGTVPMPLGLPRQCGFCSRCPQAIGGLCGVEVPALVEVEARHWVRCFLHSQEREATHG